MAPGQVPHHIRPWRDAQALYLLSPLMGFLSRAWSLLRGPGPPQPWLVEARIGADELEAGVEGEAKAPPEGLHFPRPQNPEGKAEDSTAPGEDGEAAAGPSLGLEASSSAPEAWRLCYGHGAGYGKEEADRQQPGGFTHGQPAPLSPRLLLRALPGPDKRPGDEQAEEREVAEEEGETKLAYLASHGQGGPAREEQEEAAEAVNREAAAASASPVAPGLRPSTWLCCPREEEERATEDKETENTGARESPLSPSCSSSCPGAWQSCSGEAAEKGTKAREVGKKGDADPKPRSLVPRQGLLLGPCEGQPRESAEEEDEEEDCDSRSAQDERGAGDPSTCTTDAFLRAWVYRPGEDTEEEEEEEEEEAEEGEEEDEDSDSGSAEEQGEADASSSTLGTSTFLRAWVYRPGEDTEEEDEWEENQDTEADSGAAEHREADWSPATSLQLQGTLPRAWTAPPGEGRREEHSAEARAGAGPQPLPVAIYVPGQTPPAPWATPKLPLRLQRRLRLSETLPQDQDPKVSPKDRKVRFSEKVTVHLLAVWAGPAQAARRGPWEQFARDRSRFARRIAQAQEELGPCLTPAWRARAWARLGNQPPATFLPTPSPPSPPSTPLPPQSLPSPQSRSCP
ncbi:PREDICTED: protein phosphatase 1 regulatory subunit 15A [Chinchilla lanigera]|nr:PREDICTED: protein phosphatase 1 regulatory subunit 15A [Chinchilla lanigera]